MERNRLDTDIPFERRLALRIDDLKDLEVGDKVKVVAPNSYGLPRGTVMEVFSVDEYHYKSIYVRFKYVGPNGELHRANIHDSITSCVIYSRAMDDESQIFINSLYSKEY